VDSESDISLKKLEHFFVEERLDRRQWFRGDTVLFCCHYTRCKIKRAHVEDPFYSQTMLAQGKALLATTTSVNYSALIGVANR